MTVELSESRDLNSPGRTVELDGTPSAIKPIVRRTATAAAKDRHWSLR